MTPAGVIHTLEDDGVDNASGVIGGPDNFVLSDTGSDTISIFSVPAPGETLVKDQISALDIADAGVALPGGFWNSLWAIDIDYVSLLSHGAGWTSTPQAEPWNPERIGERTGGGALYAQAGGFGANQDCRIYALVPPGGPAPVAGSGSCTPGGGLLTPRPAAGVALNHPLDAEGTPDGGFVIAEQERLARVAPDGTYTVLFTATGPDDLGIPQLDGLDVTPDGDVLFSWGPQVWRYDGSFVAAPGPPGGNPNPQPPPPPGGATSVKPTAKLAKAAYKVKRGKKLKLKVTASSAGSYALDVLRRGKRVKRKSGKVRAGANTIAFKARLKPGRYKLKLTLTAGGGTATDTATLKIRR